MSASVLVGGGTKRALAIASLCAVPAARVAHTV